MSRIFWIRLFIILLILCFIGPILVMLWEYLDVTSQRYHDNLPTVQGHPKVISGLVIGLAILAYTYVQTFQWDSKA